MKNWRTNAGSKNKTPPNRLEKIKQNEAVGLKVYDVASLLQPAVQPIVLSSHIAGTKSKTTGRPQPKASDACERRARDAIVFIKSKERFVKVEVKRSGRNCRVTPRLA